ncbi:MAG: DUF3164 family protein [Paludibacter sp.]|nr:DUF3164 family protein [Paludibacter sp.]
METTNLPVDISKLTPEQRTALFEQMKQQEKREKEAIKAERERYKDIVNETVTSLFPILVELSNRIQEVKQFVFGELETVKIMKGELFGVKQNQQSDTFTTKDGNTSIKLGYRVTDNYDDTVSSGIEKVKNYMSRLNDAVKSEKVNRLLDLLLRTDKKGNLKPSRVLELQQFANEEQDEELLDGVKIIQNSWKPSRSCNFIEVRFKDNNGFEHSLPLSISAFGLDSESDNELKKPTPEEIEEFDKQYIHQGAH